MTTENETAPAATGAQQTKSNRLKSNTLPRGMQVSASAMAGAQRLISDSLTVRPDDGPEFRKLRAALESVEMPTRLLELWRGLILDAWNAGNAVSPATLRQGAADEGIAETEVNAEIIAMMDAPYHVAESAAEIIREDKQRRDTMRALYRAADDCRMRLDKGDPDEARAALERALSQSAPSTPIGASSLPVSWLVDVLPPREFVFTEGAFPLDAVTVVSSQGGLGKSVFSLVLAASLTTGKPLLDGWTPREHGGVLLVSAEDDVPEITRRLQRIAHVYGLDDGDARRIADRLRIINPNPSRPFFVADRGGAVTAGPALEDLRRIAEAERPRLVLLDPLAALLNGLPENDNALAQACIGMLRKAIAESIATVILAHVSKAERAEAQTPRGAGAWTDAARQAFALRPLTTTEARELKAEPAANWAALELRKSNYTLSRGPQYVVKREGVPVGFDAAGFRQREAQSRERGLRDAILEAVQVCPVTRREARNAAQGDGRERGAAFREQVADLAGLEKVPASEIKAVIDAMLWSGELRENKEDNRATLIAATQTDKVAK